MLIGIHKSMLNRLKTDPGVMQGMLSAMMETANGDISMISGMIKIMKGNLPMMRLMRTGTGNKSMNDMNPMGGMGN
ncbi:MAG: hypothetical protein ABI760_17385 [Ferruginibacter sp.]